MKSRIVAAFVGLTLVPSVIVAAAPGEPAARPVVVEPAVVTPGRGLLELADERARTLAYRGRRALLVGVQNYGGSGGFSNLVGANLDAAELAAVLATRYGFEDVTLLLDRTPALTVPANVKVIVEPCVSRDVLVGHLAGLKGRVERSDALLFFFAGHGLRGALAPGRADPVRPETLVPLKALVLTLRECQAHHTLLLLDCCFSGLALERDSGCDEAVGDLSRPLQGVGGSDNLARVFGRAAFQVISAGTGSESVGDQVRLAEEYAHLARDLQGHSPFSAALLQALRGLAGRPDGLVLASELGYQMHYRLVNDERVGARQAPRYGSLGKGDGDFFFFPAHGVLNPELVVPLYRTGQEYDALREAACLAMPQSIADADPTVRGDLVRDALPHLRRLLFDPSSRPRLAAVRVLAELTEASGEDVQDFAGVIEPLLQAVAATERTLPAPEEQRRFRADTARVLGALARYATPASEAYLRGHVEGLKTTWHEATSGALLPPDVAATLKESPTEAPAVSASIAERMRFLAAERKVYQWLTDEGLTRVASYEQQEAARLEALVAAGEARLEQIKETARTGGDDKLRQGWEQAAALCVQWRGLAPSASGPRWVKLSERVRQGEAAVRKFVFETAEERYRTFGAVRRLGDAGRMRAVAVSPDGTRLLAGGERLGQWDLTGATPVHLVAAHTDEVWSVAFSQDGGRFASGSKDGTVEVRTTADARLVAVLQGHTDAVTGCVFAPDGQLLSASRDGTLRLWAADTGDSLAVLHGPGGAVNTCSVAPDGSLLAAGMDDGSLWLWDLKTQRVQRKLRVPQDGVAACLFTPDSRGLVTAGRQLLLWDAASGTLKQELGTFEASLTCCSLSADGRLLVAGGPAQLPRWDDLEGTPDGTHLVATHHGALLQIYDLPRSKLQGTITCLGNVVESCAMAADGRHLVAATHDFRPRPWQDPQVEPATTCRHRLEVWDPQASRLLRISGGGPDEVAAAQFSPDRKSVITAFFKQPARIWDVATGRARCTLGTECAVTCAFSADGCEAVTGTSRGTVHLWDATTGRLLRSFQGHEGAVRACALSPDTGEILSAADDETLRLWDRGTARVLQTFAGHGLAVTVCGFSHDGRQVLSGDQGGGVRFWHPRGRSLGMIDHHRTAVTALTFSPTDRYFLSATRNIAGIEVASGELKIWRRNGRDLLKSLPLPTETRDVSGGQVFFTERVRGAVFFPVESTDPLDVPMDLLAVQNRWILTGSEAEGNLEVPFAPTDFSGVLRLWEPNNRQVVRRFAGHSAPVISCAFSPDGRRALSLCADGSLREFPLDDLLRAQPEAGAAQLRLGRTFEEVFPGFDTDPPTAVGRAAQALWRDGAPWRETLSSGDLPSLEEVGELPAAREVAAERQAQEERGLRLLLGRNVPSAPRSGRHWLRAAAEAGSATAARRLVWALDRGLGTAPALPGYIQVGRPGDLAEAARLRAKAGGAEMSDQALQQRAAAGDSLADTLLAVKNHDRPRLERAAAHNEPDALLALAELLPEKATQYLARGAELGDPAAIFRFAQSLRDQDPDAARQHFETAAFLGDTDAVLALADLLEKESDRRSDNLRKAAEAWRSGTQSSSEKDEDEIRVIDFSPPEGWRTLSQTAEEGVFANDNNVPTLTLNTERRIPPHTSLADEFRAWLRQEIEGDGTFEGLLRLRQEPFKGVPAWTVVSRHQGGILNIRLLAVTQRFHYRVSYRVTDYGGNELLHEAFFQLLVAMRMNLGHPDDLFPPGAADELAGAAAVARSQAELDRMFQEILAPSAPAGEILERASAFAKQDQWAEAIHLCDRAVARNPKSREAYCLRAEGYAREKKPDLVIADYTRALALTPDDPAALCGRARAHLDKKDWARALADFDRALALEPKRTDALKGRGDVHFGRGDLQAAIADYSRAVELDRDYQPGYYERAWTHFKLKDYVRAVADYDRVLELTPKFAAAYRERGDAYREMGQLDRAIADYDAAAKLDVLDARTYASRGRARVEKKDLTRALTDLDLAVQLEPGEPLHDYHLARCHSLCAASLSEDPPDQQKKRNWHVQQAFESLRRLKSKGFGGWEELRTDKSFDVLRGKSDFDKLVTP